MLLHCVRHGLTIENTQGVYHGTSDGTLTLTQRAALETTHFEASSNDAVYCSPLGRCVETARALRIPRVDLHGGAQIFSASNASLSAFDVRFPDVELIVYVTRLDGA